MAIPPLTPEQQAQAEQLQQALRPDWDDLLAEVSRLLVVNADAPFGAPEFALRDLLLRAGAAALQASLREKKTATRDPR